MTQKKRMGTVTKLVWICVGNIVALTWATFIAGLYGYDLVDVLTAALPYLGGELVITCLIFLLSGKVRGVDASTSATQSKTTKPPG